MDSRTSRFQEPSMFRYQPPYTYFNKSFEDAGDSLFLHLNEINPIFMRDQQIERGFDYDILMDPRTKEEVKCILYDYSKNMSPHVDIFQSLVKSNLNKTEHSVCLRMLEFVDAFGVPSENDMRQWSQLKSKLLKEKSEFHKFVLDYAQTRKETIYAPTERFVTQYKRLYAVKLDQLLKETPENVAFNTVSGLPHVQSLKSNPSRSAQIDNVRLVTRKGWVPVATDYSHKDFQQLNLRLENYMDNYIDYLRINQDADWVGCVGCEGISHTFYIPLESLLFLLTAGDYPDLPTEVALEIAEGGDSTFKMLKFDEPLPARNCGWHTHKHVLENAFTAFMSNHQQTKWLHVEDASVQLEQLCPPPEIEAVHNTKRQYLVYGFEEYIQKFATGPKVGLKTNSAVIKWVLSNKDDDQNNCIFQLYTNLKLPPTLDESGQISLGSHSVKLEYKSQFGVELMTKYELLKEWLQLKLMVECGEAADHAICLRIAAKDFSVQLKQRLMLSAIEKQLDETYRVKMPQLLAGLADFFKLLLNMSAGKYLLRYNIKYRDKLLLCAPTKDITANTVFLHTMIKVEPSDLAFMTQTPYLPISDSLCSVVHKFYNIIPCAFMPLCSAQKGRPLQRVGGKKVLSDKDYRQKQLDAKAEKKKKILKKIETRRKRHKRLLRVRKRRKEKKDEETMNKQLETLFYEC